MKSIQLFIIEVWTISTKIRDIRMCSERASERERCIQVYYIFIYLYKYQYACLYRICINNVIYSNGILWMSQINSIYGMRSKPVTISSWFVAWICNQHFFLQRSNRATRERDREKQRGIANAGNVRNVAKRMNGEEIGSVPLISMQFTCG